MKDHAFFEGLDWTALGNKKVKPPYKPIVRDKTDVTYIDEEFLQEVPADTPISDNLLNFKNKSTRHLFKDFSFQETSTAL